MKVYTSFIELSPFKWNKRLKNLQKSRHKQSFISTKFDRITTLNTYDMQKCKKKTVNLKYKFRSDRNNIKLRSQINAQ